MFSVDKTQFVGGGAQISLPLTKTFFHMSVLLVLIITSMIVAGGFLAAFIWSVKKGQYDDDYTPSVRMLFDDQPANNQSGGQ